MKNYIRILCISILTMLIIVGCNNKDDMKSTGSIRVNDTDIYYNIEGSGIPCIVLGPTKVNQRIFSTNLKNHFRFIFTDTRSFSSIKTPADISSITIDTLVDDIEILRKALNINKIAVLGHSALGFVAIEYSRKYPQNTSHAIVIATPPYYTTKEYNTAVIDFWESDASQERKDIWKNNQEMLAEGITDTLTPNDIFLLGYVANGPRMWYDLSNKSSWIVEGLNFNMDLVNNFYDVILHDYDITDSYYQIKTPLFLALGRKDYWAPYYLWDNVKEKLPNLSYNLFEKSGHYPMVEERELFDNKLIEWIKSH